MSMGVPNAFNTFLTTTWVKLVPELFADLLKPEFPIDPFRLMR